MATKQSLKTTHLGGPRPLGRPLLGVFDTSLQIWSARDLARDGANYQRKGQLQLIFFSLWPTNGQNTNPDGPQLALLFSPPTLSAEVWFSLANKLVFIPLLRPKGERKEQKRKRRKREIAFEKVLHTEKLTAWFHSRGAATSAPCEEVKNACGQW